MPDGPTPSSVKVVITGGWGTGKTTLIQSLSEIAVLTTKRRLGGDAVGSGDTDIVAMDFGRMTVDDGLRLHLFGTSSRDRFAYIADIVSQGLLGFVVIVDDSRPDSAHDAMGMLTHCRDQATVPYVIAVNKVVPAQAERATRRARHSLRVPDHVRVVAVDARSRESAKHLILQLLSAAIDNHGTVAEARTA